MRPKKESGAIVIVFLLVLVPIIALIALAIDVSRLAEASSKAKASTGLAALGGLESYYYTKPPVGMTDPHDIYQLQLTAAFDRIEQILTTSESANIGAPGTPLVQTGVHEFRDASGALTGRASDVTGTITPGRWFFSEPGGSCADWDPSGVGAPDTETCPCGGLAKVWTEPCFRANDATDTQLTALKVDFHSKSGGTGIGTEVRSVFGQIIGIDTSQYSFSIIAALAPRALAFSVDNSRSMTFANFVPATTSSPAITNAEYVYPLKVGTDPGCRTNHGNPCDSIGDCKFVNSYYTVMYESMLMRGARDLSTPESSKVHYYDDYECFDVVDNGVAERYLIATKIGYDVDDDGNGVADADKYNGPEPLNSVLQGIYAMVSTLEQISVAGDSVLVFSFDQRSPSDFTVAATNALKRQVGPASLGTTEFNELKSVVKTEGQTMSDVHNRIDHLFFPMSAASTDIPGAMMYALDQLDKMGSNESLRMHTTFTDGASECSHYSNGGPFREFLVKDNVTQKYNLKADHCMNAQSYPGNFGLKGTAHTSSSWGANAFGNHVWSMFEANAIASKTSGLGKTENAPYNVTNPEKSFANTTTFKSYKDLGMKFNVVIVGDTAMPHTVLKQSAQDSSKCMTDAEARAGNDWFTSFEPTGTNNYNIDANWDAFNDPSVANPYTLATVFMYEAARATDGFFFPIRKSCAALDPANVDANCMNGGVSMTDYLDAQCAANPHYPTPSACRFTTNWVNSHVYAGPYTDACGRLKCDPKCMDVADQVGDAMRQMLSQNPFVLVSPLH